MKDLLLVFSDTKQPYIGTNFENYLNIKGINWNHYNIKKEKYIYVNSKIKLKILKDSEIVISGQNGYIQAIDLIDSQPNKRFKKILEANLGKGVVKELFGCKSQFSETEKAYEITFPNGAVIYVDAEANFESEPFMSPLYTLFKFSLIKPSNWKC